MVMGRDNEPTQDASGQEGDAEVKAEPRDDSR